MLKKLYNYIITKFFNFLFLLNSHYNLKSFFYSKNKFFILMKNKKAADILQDLLNKNLGVKINQLEKDYNIHTENLDICFNIIEYMKSKNIKNLKRSSKDLPNIL